MTFDEWWARQVFKDDYKEFARRVWIAAREIKPAPQRLLAEHSCKACGSAIPAGALVKDCSEDNCPEKWHFAEAQLPQMREGER